MSDPTRYTESMPDISYGMDESKKGEYVLYKDYAKLKAENERLRSGSFVTAVPSEQYERVIKAGDAMAYELHSCEPDRQIALIEDWFASKEGRDAK